VTQFVLGQVDATSLTLPVGAVLVLFSAVVPAVVAWALMRRRIEEVERTSESHGEQLAELAGHREKHALELQSMSKDLGYTRSALERIEIKLERLLSRGDE
jgi:hypothetical protein